MRCLTIALIAAPVFAAAEPLRVVTDVPAVHSLVSQVMGERGQVSVLLDKNADPHHFQLRPSQSRELASSDLLIWVGEDLTPWLARARDGVASDIASLSFLEHSDDGEQGEEEDHDDGHGHDGSDPHIWLSIHKSEGMLHEIAEYLGDLDPEGAEVYRANAASALDRLAELEHAIESQLTGISDVPFVVGHDAYGYFIDAYGLNMVDSLTDVHDSPASAKHISKLARMAEQNEIVCVFPEVGESDKLAQVLVDKGARLGPALDPEGVSFELGPDLHLQLLAQLAENFRTCLAP